MYGSFIEMFCLLTLWVSGKSKKIYTRIYRGFEWIFKNSVAAQQITADGTSHLHLILLWLLANSFRSLWYGSQISHRKRTNAKLDLLNYNALQPKLHINIGLQTWHQILSLFNGSMEVLELFWNIFSGSSVLLLFFLHDGRKGGGGNQTIFLYCDSATVVLIGYSSGLFRSIQLKTGSVNGSLCNLDYRWCCQCHMQYIIVQGLYKV